MSDQDKGAVRNEVRKQRSRLALLDDLLDYALRSACSWVRCNGPLAPIRHMQTCSRCSCIHRAIQMGLVQECKGGYVRKTREGMDVYVQSGTLEQLSAVNGQVVE